MLIILDGILPTKKSIEGSRNFLKMFSHRCSSLQSTFLAIILRNDMHDVSGILSTPFTLGISTPEHSMRKPFVATYGVFALKTIRYEKIHKLYRYCRFFEQLLKSRLFAAIFCSLDIENAVNFKITYRSSKCIEKSTL